MRAVVNEALRRGLELLPGGPRRRFEVVPHDLGARPGVDLDDVEGLLDALEGPGRR